MESDVPEAAAEERVMAGEKPGLAAAALAAMGVVFGDIGTSPLYTVREIFTGHHPVAVTPDNVLGILSLVFWAMTITVSLKYVFSSPAPTTRAREASWR